MTRAGFFVVVALGGSTLLAQAPPSIIFTDVTRDAGIRWSRNNGADGRKLLPESLGGGAALFDADGDGHLDLLLINGKDWTAKGRLTRHGLFRNRGNGTFTDISRGSGLDVDMYGIGAAVGDYDNDGRDDVYVTAVGGDRLFRNQGGGRFRDVTATSGMANDAMGVSAAWLDYDRDGHLDLYVGNYVRWSVEGDVRCSYDGATKGYCGPGAYQGMSAKLFRNTGQGRFEDVTRRAGVDMPQKALGVAVLDVNGDGWPDIYSANDQVPSRLFQNNRNGTFTDIGARSGVAFSEEGVARANMGTDAADYDRSGRAHIAVGNFANEMLGLYRNEGNGIFVDEAPRSAVGRASFLMLTWAVYFLDYDLDGWLDIFTANGHIDEKWTGGLDPRVTFRQPLLMMRNQGQAKKATFENVTARLGTAFSAPRLARGAAHGDIDNDGDTDIIVTTQDGPVTLLRNDGGNRNAWLRVRAIGSASNRSGIGAVVRVIGNGGTQTRMVRSGSGYASASDLALTFGLGADRGPQTVEVDWPSGRKDRATGIMAGQTVVATEGKGVTPAGAPIGAASSRRP